MLECVFRSDHSLTQSGRNTGKVRHDRVGALPAVEKDECKTCTSPAVELSGGCQVSFHLGIHEVG
jgi:hypothetical protein